MSLTVAYFTMEIGLKAEVPTYAGGLGMLAADLMLSAADMGVPAACVTMCWQHGYMHQTIRSDGSQSYEEMGWNPAQYLELLPQKVTVTLEGRAITVGAWVLPIRSNGHEVPVIFLDTNVPENRSEDRAITSYLYGGDGVMRIKQEAVLGIAGVRMLRALGYGDIGTFHMNEGHAAFLTLELLKERGFKDEAVRPSCAFTTHTPVKAGHDVFPYDMAWRVMGDNLPWHIKNLAGADQLSMTHLAMHLSKRSFAVSRVHGMVSNQMFPGENIDYITNGVHLPRWTSPEMQTLFDKYAVGWKNNPHLLSEHCREIPDNELGDAHHAAKRRLLAIANQYAVSPLQEDTLTIASARRVVAYKRPELLYTNLERLKEVCGGHVQIIHAGNAHPADQFGQDVIQRMIERSRALKDTVKIVYLPNYNPELAKLMVAGADVWLNTPTRLHEASGTSGMKAAINGTLNLSTLDGWWIKGHEMDPQSGWRIGPLSQALDADDTRQIDAEDFYTQLQYQVIPEFYYRDHVRWMRRMKRTIGLAGHFNTHRCIGEYMTKAWGTADNADSHQ
ncbi:MAG: alpha-glucan family phosphorylase [Candidatus Peribacteraceae bacterium]|nr:alpha-glucan family phosphorylase [Candidatus Peribacteraceae bacterium]